MFQDILFALWFLLPAATANAIPVFAAAFPLTKNLDSPIDAGKTFHGRRIFGSHKTWRGLIAGILIAILTLWIQQLFAASFSWAQYASGSVNYASLPVLILGPLFAVGALGGDAIKSFFKRQRNIKSGATWIPFDQLDYILGSVAISLFFVALTPVQYVWIFILWFIIHILASYLGYKLGLKKDPI